MHDIRRLGLQVFAAPNNLTGEVQIEVKAREIDFVTSFGKNLKALLDILGITRMIRKENNSVLKTKEFHRRSCNSIPLYWRNTGRIRKSDYIKWL